MATEEPDSEEWKDYVKRRIASLYEEHLSDNERIDNEEHLSDNEGIDYDEVLGRQSNLGHIAAGVYMKQHSESTRSAPTSESALEKQRNETGLKVKEDIEKRLERLTSKRQQRTLECC
eukprot:CAMPEP_0117893676 /NCGR_PEP_ID=MMETSP0950-20121206/25471_1 /TAXON_ID=44440 /ORGANISM="Chattonella subsalsa, Strain CCMP2191" /LENGTH=117 /DNA_ID=CAMNT_0005753987 /DNA_START=24 /DNA_END=377 /DNA_ORIENTATION=+